MKNKPQPSLQVPSGRATRHHEESIQQVQAAFGGGGAKEGGVYSAGALSRGGLRWQHWLAKDEQIVERRRETGRHVLGPETIWCNHSFLVAQW